MKIVVMANAQATHTRRWARAFAERGHDVTVLSIRGETIPDVKVISCHVGKINSRSPVWTLLSYIRLLVSARRLLQKIGPDVLHAHYVSTHGVIAAFSRFGPVVLTAWGSDIIPRGKTIPWYRRRFLRFALRRADRVTSTSLFLRKWMLSLVEREIDIVPFGVDCDTFRPDESIRPQYPPEHLRIGFVKTLAPIYGPDILLLAFRRVREKIPSARLILVGRDRTAGRLARFARSMNLADHVEFAGFVPNDQIPALLNSFDIVVNPTVCDESFGVAVLEASACGRPVVASRVGGVPEVCIAEKTALLVPRSDPAALASALIRLAESPALRADLGARGRRFVLENYPWPACIDKMLAVLAAAVKDFPPQSPTYTPSPENL